MTPAALDAVVAGFAPVVREAIAAAVAPLVARIAALEARPFVAQPGRDGRDGLRGERGEAGHAGAKGDPGPEGSPGLVMAAEDFATAEYDGERGMVLTFGKGDRAVRMPIQFPIPIYRGVYEDTRSYEPADVVTHAGSVWIAKTATTARPSDLFAAGQQAWTLMAKRGRDGRAGKDARATA